MTTPDLSSVLVSGIKTAFVNLGSVGRVVVALILGVIVVPWILRILSFFRRGGTSV